MMTEAKLTQKQVELYRPILLERQGGVCPLCGKQIIDDPVLDHDHNTGRVRAVLHRHCNVLEGKITNWARSYGKNTDVLTVLQNLSGYWDGGYGDNPYHPKHKTDVEKQIKRLTALVRSAKRPETVQKHKQAIKALKSQLVRYQL